MKTGAADLANLYRVCSGKKFRIEEFDPGHTAHLKKEKAQKLLQEGIEKLTKLQEKLYAQDRWAVLLVFQAMDAAGKDSTIKHVMSGVNPQGCQVSTFKVPGPKELDHDFLWRSSAALPERGQIGVFNRSYYEEVLVVRVHPECLQNEKLPEKLVSKEIWKERFEDINAYERYLTRNGVVIRKFFLNLSKKEQRKRIEDRLNDPDKNWKFAAADIKERSLWDKYMHAYQDAIQHTATPHAPWYIVPADHKWFSRLVVIDAIVETLESLHLEFPKVSPEQKAELDSAREELDNE